VVHALGRDSECSRSSALANLPKQQLRALVEASTGQFIHLFANSNWIRIRLRNMDSKTLKIGIVSGVISSLLVLILIQPILGFVWRTVLAIAGSIHQGFVDRIYRDAAAPNETALFGIVLIVLFWVALLVATVWWEQTRFFMLAASDKVQRAPFLDVIFRSTTLTVVKLILVSTEVFVILFALTAMALASGISQLNTSFVQRLTILAPAISDVEYKTLKAQWATMRSKADYDALVAKMDKRAHELGVTLPPVRNP
jgi:hypothetical protein